MFQYNYLQININVFSCYRLNFSTPFSTNAVSICKSIGLDKVYRIEMCTRYSIKSHATLNCADVTRISALLHDRMTQCRYTQPIKSFKLSIKSEPVYAVNVMEEGRAALEKANQHLGKYFTKYLYSLMFTLRAQ